MRAAFALLADRKVHNFVRRLAWDIHLKHNTGTRHCRLPSHISLKQPFAISDLAALEVYMDELARSIEPFEIHLPEIQVMPTAYAGVEYGILWLDVEETAYLRQLHNRVNRELADRFGNTSANFDGADYHFHMTVMLGGQPVEAYRQFLDELPDPEVNLRFMTTELALFVYDEPMGPDGEYLSYKTLTLGK